MTPYIQLEIRRGLKANLPSPLNDGELGFCEDTGELFIGNSLGQNVKLNINYTPATPGNWNGQPTTIIQALDRLAAAVEGLLGGPIP